jgi:hypothetical protein
MERPRPLAAHHRIAGTGPGRFRIAQQARSSPLQPRWRREPQRSPRWSDRIPEIHRPPAHLPRSLRSRRDHDQRRPGRTVEQRHFVPPPVLAQVQPVVAEEDDQGVARRRRPFQRRQHLTQLRVHERGARVVRAPELPAFFPSEVVPHRRVRRFRDVALIVRRPFGNRDLLERVRLEVFLRRKDRGLRGPARKNGLSLRSSSSRPPPPRSARPAGPRLSLGGAPSKNANLPPVRFRPRQCVRSWSPAGVRLTSQSFAPSSS